MSASILVLSSLLVPHTPSSFPSANHSDLPTAALLLDWGDSPRTLGKAALWSAGWLPAHFISPPQRVLAASFCFLRDMTATDKGYRETPEQIIHPACHNTEFGSSSSSVILRIMSPG